MSFHFNIFVFVFVFVFLYEVPFRCKDDYYFKRKDNKNSTIDFLQRKVSNFLTFSALFLCGSVLIRNSYELSFITRIVKCKMKMTLIFHHNIYFTECLKIQTGSLCLYSIIHNFATTDIHHSDVFYINNFFIH